MQAIRFDVEGRVQGVGFRWFVREAARRLGLSGRVSNRSDGTVRVEVAGPEEALADLERRIRTGPPGAIVRNVQRSPLASPDALPHPFAVDRTAE